MFGGPSQQRQRPQRSRGSVDDGRGGRIDLDELLVTVNQHRTLALNDRRRYEAAWQLAAAFVAGRQWVGWDPKTRRVVLEANPRRRERHTVNVLTRYFWTAIGKVYNEEFKPDLWFARTDQMAQEFTAQARRAFDFAWDVEVRADEVILDLIIDTFAFGTAGIRCLYNNQLGAHQYDAPVHHQTGEVMLDPKEARAYVGDRRYYGEDVKFRAVFEGRTEWQNLSPFNVWVPPGIPNERNFPYVGIDMPVPIEDVKALYPKLGDIQEQTLSSVDLVGLRDAAQFEDPGAGGSGKLRGHVILSTEYFRPSAKYPQGLEVTWTQDKIADVQPKLPYKVNGERKAGIVFFKYHRLPRRFWAQGVLEPGVGPQRQRNRARSQMIEMKDKNLGRVYAYKGTITEANRPVGKIMELIEVSKSAPALPQETAGVPPGAWIAEEASMNDADLDKVMGLGDVSLSQAPRGVSAYSAFALLSEEDDRRVGPILKGIRTSMIALSQVTMASVKEYWPDEKQIVLAGVNDEVDAFVFNASDLPEALYFRFSTGGPPTPKSPAAQIQLIFDLFDRSISSARPLPLTWLYNSLKQGKPLPLPDEMNEVQQKLANLENQLMNEGHMVQVHPSDVDQVHIPIHQAALAALSLIPGAQPVIEIITEHLQEHEQRSSQQQASAAAVPGMQGPMGALGAPQAAPPALDAMQLADASRSVRFANDQSPRPPNVGGYGAGQ